MEFQTTDAYSSLDRTSAMYSLSIDSIEDKLKVILRISNNNNNSVRYVVGALVEALCYKPEYIGFDSRLGQ
jgi:hypothetical protein